MIRPFLIARRIKGFRTDEHYARLVSRVDVCRFGLVRRESVAAVEISKISRDVSGVSAERDIHNAALA